MSLPTISPFRESPLADVSPPATPPARRGANAYFAASGAAQIIALIRYVVLARMLGPEQLGLTATLVVMATFFDMVSDAGSDRFLIQDRDGDTPEVQSLVQLFYIGRGAATALILAVFAWPIAMAYGTPQLTIGLALLGVSRFILGFVHLDLRRSQRHLDFRSEATALIWAEFSGLFATGLAAYLTHNYTAILYGLTARAMVMVAVSHLRSTRPYRIGFSNEHAARLGRFAMPLMINGVLLFLATQGDRALVGRQLGLVTLGRYSAILLLIFYPVSTITRYIQTMYLPLLARTRDDDTERNRLANVMGGQVLLLAILMSAGFALVAPLAVTVLYGSRFSEAASTVALIGILQTSRFLQVYPTVVALSAGRSVGPLAVNTTRLLAYPAAFLGGLTLGGLPGVLAGFVSGELLAQAIGLIMLNRVFKRPTLDGFDRILMFILSSGVVLAIIWAFQRPGPLSQASVAFGGCVLAGWIVHRERPAIVESVTLLRRITRGLSPKFARA